jgi:hypothetical protein
MENTVTLIHDWTHKGSPEKECFLGKKSFFQGNIFFVGGKSLCHKNKHPLLHLGILRNIYNNLAKPLCLCISLLLPNQHPPNFRRHGKMKQPSAMSADDSGPVSGKLR